MNTAEQTETGTDIIPIHTVKAHEIFMPGGCDQLIEIARQAVINFKGDITTEEGRKEITRFDRKIASSKTAIDKLRLQYTKGLRDQIDVVNKEGAKFVQQMEELQESVTAELDQWKQAEKNRIDGLKARVDNIQQLGTNTDDATSADLKLSLMSVNKIYADTDWQDFAELAQQAYEESIQHLTRMIVTVESREADMAELTRLRELQAAVEAEAEKERLRKEGEERATREAQEKIDQANRMAAQAETDRRMRLSSGIDKLSMMMNGITMDSSSEAIKARIESVNLFHAQFGDWQEKAEEAEEIRRDTILHLTEMAKECAEHEARQRAEQAEAEAKRIRDAELAAEKLREQDKQHRATINRAALEAMVEHSKVSADNCRAVLTAIAQGKIPNVKIMY